MSRTRNRQHAVATLESALSDSERAATIERIEAVVGPGNVGALAPGARNPVGRSMFWVLLDDAGQAAEIARLPGVKSCNIQPERHAV
ncbi:hypothetical protein EDC22_102443 [Tepidamorphus gemmatus]|uniref:Uncharacterized protein n=1 Tax=Tepidamorphus gemmatus TaxID=747076 RepID=A0A4R3MHP4_9HYPH|nr:hypothetical protein [Tepidamorphus gemmatus]TCT12757.1 hypothetical protein EDC22_102443 [Tepidamorphus gemmatus]